MSMHTKQHTFRGSRARTAADTSFLGFLSNFGSICFAVFVFQPCKEAVRKKVKKIKINNNKKKKNKNNNRNRNTILEKPLRSIFYCFRGKLSQLIIVH